MNHMTPAVKLQVNKKDLSVVFWCDCTKLGVLQQKEINAMAENARVILQQNAERMGLGSLCLACKVCVFQIWGACMYLIQVRLWWCSRLCWADQPAL